MKTRGGVLGVVVLSFMVGLVAQAWAQGAKKHPYVTGGAGKAKYTQTHVIDVGDVPGHQLRIFELHTVWEADGPVYDGVKVKERTARGFSDYTGGTGTAIAYAVNVLENGDRIFERLDILSQTAVAPDGSRKLGFRFVSTLTGGTGRFKGIRGTLMGGGGSDLRTGTTDTWTQGEYWFEP